MGSKREQEYIARHERIRDKLTELYKESGHACFEVSKVASELGMDKRTVKAHLKVMVVDYCGIFVDPDEKQFCTKEGIHLLANMLKIKDEGNK